MNVRNTRVKPVKASEPEMRTEYDFSGAVRGKYYRRFVESSNVVVIDPDVHERFKSAAAVNEALRTLIRAAGREPGLTLGATDRRKRS